MRERSYATDTCPGRTPAPGAGAGECRGESLTVVVETLRIRSHRPEGSTCADRDLLSKSYDVSLREGDINEMISNNIRTTGHAQPFSPLSMMPRMM